MEVEAKFILETDAEEILALLRRKGYTFTGPTVQEFTDLYYSDGCGVLRFRFFKDGRIVRTYKKDLRVEGAVVTRLEEEEILSQKPTLEDKPDLRTSTLRYEYVSSGFKLTYDDVFFPCAGLKLSFLEVEGEPDKVKEVADTLMSLGLRPERRSKFSLGVEICSRH